MPLFRSLRFWAVIFFGPFVVIWLVMAVIYAVTPVYIDHAESAIVITTFQWLHGRPLYHAADSPYIYGFLLGPFDFLWLALVLKICPDPVLASKLAGGFWALGSIALMFALFRRISGSRVVAITGMGVVASGLLLDMLAPFWDRPDPILFFMVTLGLVSLSVRNRKLAAVILVLVFAVVIDCKIHGVLYLLPSFVIWFRRHGWRPCVAIAFLGTAIAFVPFLLPGISLKNYIFWLQLGIHQERTLDLFWESLETVLEMMLPLVLFAGHPQLKFVAWAKATEECILFYALILAGVLVSIPASKVGAGWHHLLPLAVYVGYLFCLLLRNSPDQLKYRWTLLVVVLSAFLSYNKTINNVSFVLWYMQAIPYQEMQADLKKILQIYPAAKTQVGIGAGNPGYIATFYSPWLYREGTPRVANMVSYMDMKEVGLYSPALKNSLETEQFSYWLIPRDGPPFTMNSWYDSLPLFDDSARQAFAQHYVCVARSVFFDIYQSKSSLPK